MVDQLLRRHRWRILACLAAALLAAVVFALLAPAPSGALLLELQFAARPAGTVEPLLVTGRPYAGDQLQVRYLEPGKVVLVWNTYGKGGPTSPPLSVSPSKPVVLRVDAPTLYRRLERRALGTIPDDVLAVDVDGRRFWEVPVDFYRSAPEDIHIGLDPSFAERPGSGARFSGQLALLAQPTLHVPAAGIVWLVEAKLLSHAGLWLALAWAAYLLGETLAWRLGWERGLELDTRIAATAGLAAVLAYAFLGSAGQPFALGRRLTGYPEGYNQMTEAFAHGQLALLQKPSPALLALPNPYDARQNEGLRLHDAILYHGRYYYYFSPLPAVLLNLPVLELTGTDLPQNLAVVLWAGGGTALLLAALVVMKRRWRPELSPWLLGALAASIAFAPPVVYLLGRPTMYEQPVAAAYAFLGLGFLGLAKAMAAPRDDAGKKRRGGCFAWAMASACGFALAAACRPNIALACPGLGLAWLLAARKPRTAGAGATGESGGAVSWLRVGALCLPFVAVGAGLCALNVLRFGAPLEFGWRWQLWGREQLASEATNFSLRNVAPNAQHYLYGPPKFKAAFPYVFANARKVYFRSPYTIGAEPLVGITWAAPLAAAALAAWALRLRRRDLSDPSKPDSWIGALVVAGGGVLFFAHLYSAFAMRYMPDFLPFVEVAGALALMGLARRGGEARWLRWTALSVSLAVAAGGLAMALNTGYLGFSWSNPELYARLASLFP